MNSSIGLNLLAPFAKNKLGRYKTIGVFIIRRNDEILYIGKALNIYETASRLFQHRGKLEEININAVTFEIILCETEIQCNRTFSYLKDDFIGTFNYKSNAIRNLSKHHKQKKKKVLEEYRTLSIFYEVGGSHKSDKD